MPYTDFCVTIKPRREAVAAVRDAVEEAYVTRETGLAGDHYPRQYDLQVADGHVYFGRRDQQGHAFEWGEQVVEDGIGDGLLAVLYDVEPEHVGYGSLYEWDDGAGEYAPVPEVVARASSGLPYEGERGGYGVDIVTWFAELRDIEPARYRNGHVRRPSEDSYGPPSMRD